MKSLAVCLAMALGSLLCGQVTPLAVDLTGREDDSQPNKTSSQSGLRVPYQPAMLHIITIAETSPQPPPVGYTTLQLGGFYASQLVSFWNMDTAQPINPPMSFLYDGFPNMQMIYRKDPTAGAPIFNTQQAMYAILRLLQIGTTGQREILHPANVLVSENGRRVGTITSLVDVPVSRAPPQTSNPVNGSQAVMASDTPILQSRDANVTLTNMDETERVDVNQTRSVTLPQNLGIFGIRIDYVDRRIIPGYQLVRVILACMLSFMTWPSDDAAFSHFVPDRRYWQVDGQNPTFYGRIVLPSYRPALPVTTMEDVVACLLIILDASAHREPMVGFKVSCFYHGQNQPWMTVLVTGIRPNPGPPASNDGSLFPSITGF